MKKIINLLLLLAVVLFVACDETIETPETLEVKPYNLEGTWVLAELNGDALADSAYVYLVIDRGYTYEIYENTASMYPVLFTGKYELEYDWRVGDVISGTYDYDLGAWDHEYVITNLYEKSMTWTAKDDASYVQEFVRVDAVPAEIVEAVRK
jgi:hypothetical protein